MPDVYHARGARREVRGAIGSHWPGRAVYLMIPAGRCPLFVRKWRNWQTRKPQELVAARS